MEGGRGQAVTGDGPPGQEPLYHFHHMHAPEVDWAAVSMEWWWWWKRRGGGERRQGTLKQSGGPQRPHVPYSRALMLSKAVMTKSRPRQKDALNLFSDLGSTRVVWAVI
jgi:hypothetical protein